MTCLFELGRAMTTPLALHAMRRNGLSPQTLLYRHVTGDWGELNAACEDRNYDAVGSNGQIFSAFLYPESTFYVITSADRRITTILLPSEL